MCVCHDDLPINKGTLFMGLLLSFKMDFDYMMYYYVKSPFSNVHI